MMTLRSEVNARLTDGRQRQRYAYIFTQSTRRLPRQWVFTRSDVLYGQPTHTQTGPVDACRRHAHSRVSSQPTNVRNGKNRKLQTIGTAFFPAELVNFFLKSIVQISVRFLIAVQFTMQIKFNSNNFILYGVSATTWQRASGIRRRRWRL